MLQGNYYNDKYLFTEITIHLYIFRFPEIIFSILKWFCTYCIYITFAHYWTSHCLFLVFLQQYVCERKWTWQHWNSIYKSLSFEECYALLSLGLYSFLYKLNNKLGIKIIFQPLWDQRKPKNFLKKLNYSIKYFYY